MLPKRYLFLCFHKPPHSTNQGYQLYQPSMQGYKQDSSRQQQQTYLVPAALEKKYDPIFKWALVHLRIQIWMCILNYNIQFTKYLHAAMNHKLNRKRNDKKGKHKTSSPCMTSSPLIKFNLHWSLNYLIRNGRDLFMENH